MARVVRRTQARPAACIIGEACPYCGDPAAHGDDEVARVYGCPKRPRWRVRWAQVDARPLVTIRAEKFRVHPTFEPGSIVRVFPPNDATDGEVEALDALLRKLGAVAVKMLPRAPGAAVVGVEAKDDGETKSIREVVMAMIDEARTGDREALREFVERLLAVEGL